MANFLFGSYLISAEHVHAARRAHEQILEQGLSHQTDGILMLEGSHVTARWINLDQLKAHARQAGGPGLSEPVQP